MIIQSILNRRSIRSFKPDPIGDYELTEILRAVQMAPTAMNNRSVECLVVSNQEIKDQFSARLGDQFLREAPLLLVLVADTRRSVLPIQDLSVASSFVFLQAADMGLGTVWKDIRAEQVPQVRELLNIPDTFTLVNIIPLGYAKEPLEPHSEEEFADHKIHLNQW